MSTSWGALACAFGVWRSVADGTQCHWSSLTHYIGSRLIQYIVDWTCLVLASSSVTYKKTRVTGGRTPWKRLALEGILNMANGTLILGGHELHVTFQLEHCACSKRSVLGEKIACCICIAKQNECMLLWCETIRVGKGHLPTILWQQVLVVEASLFNNKIVLHENKILQRRVLAQRYCGTSQESVIFIIRPAVVCLLSYYIFCDWESRANIRDLAIE